MKRILLMTFYFFSLGIALPLLNAEGMDQEESSFSNNKQKESNHTYRTSHQAEGTICPLRPCASNGFMAGGELLWWRAGLDNLAYTIQVTSASTQTSDLQLKIKEPGFSYDPGFRLGLGYDFGENNWDVKLSWTRYTTHSSSSAPAQGALEYAFYIQDISPSPFFSSPRGGDSLLDGQFSAIEVDKAENSSTIAPQSIPGSIPLQDRVKGSWHLKFNALDLELGYPLCVAPRFTVRPYMGVKAAWIEMKLRIASTMLPGLVLGSGETPFITTIGSDLSIRLKSNFWGVGPQFGIDGFLPIGGGINLFGKISTAFLYGEYHGENKHHRTVTTTPPSTPFFVDTTVFNDQTLKHKNYFRLRAMAQALLGLEWKMCIANYFQLGAHVAWETQYWWNQQQFPFFDRNTNRHGDLTFAGLSAGIELKF